jgi:GWxTD domain-containing protein
MNKIFDKKAVRLLCYICLGLYVTACQTYSSLHTVNLEYRYDATRPLNLQHMVLDAGNSLRLYVSIEAKKIAPNAPPQTLLDNYGFIANISNSYKSKYILQRDTLVPMLVSRDKKGIFCAVFDIPKIQNVPFAVMALNIYEKGSDRDFVVDIPLEFTPVNPMQNKYGLFTAKGVIPFTSKYITTRDSLVIKSLSQETTRKLYVKHIALEGFAASLPPMAINSATMSKKSLQVKRRFEIRPNQTEIFTESGLYFVQEDSASNNGFAVVVAPNKYPQVTVPEELIAPLVYISTRDERNRLVASKKPKETLDQFWLDIGGNRDHARTLIRSYYENVEEANRLFTSFQEGWKTDRGMVFVIFGKPDRLVRYDDHEEWYYEKNANYPDIYFTFVKKPTIFTPEHYEMVRFGEYDRAWYGTVEQWRKGVLRR